MVLPYVIFYHCVAMLKFFRFELIGNLLALLIIGAMSIHVYVLNRRTIWEMISRVVKRSKRKGVKKQEIKR